jgi:putative transposase
MISAFKKCITVKIKFSMSTFTQILYQIVFSTKKGERTMNYENSEKLYHYIWGVLKNKNCKLYQLNGTEDHLHILTHIHPSVSLSSLVKDIKISSSLYIKQEKLFPYFSSWQEGYGAFTYHINQKEVLLNYIKGQRDHHHKKTFKEELIELLKEHGIEFDEKYLL